MSEEKCEVEYFKAAAPIVLVLANKVPEDNECAKIRIRRVSRPLGDRDTYCTSPLTYPQHPILSTMID